MTFTVTNLITAAGSNTDATTYTTASLTSVPAGTFLVACVANGVSAQPAEDISQIIGTLGSTLTWTNRGSALISVSFVARTSIWTALMPSTASGTLIFDFGAANTQSNCQWQILGVTATGTIAVTNVETEQDPSINPSMTIAPSPPAGSCVIGALTANGTTAATPGSGWTLNSAGTSQTSPACIMAVQYDTTNPGSNFNWTQAVANNRSQVAITLEESTPVARPRNIRISNPATPQSFIR